MDAENLHLQAFDNEKEKSLPFNRRQETTLDNMPPNKYRRLLTSDGGKDLVTAICILLFAIGGFVFINSDGANVYPGEGGITWQTMPFVYAGLLLLLGVIYAVQSYKKIQQEMATPLSIQVNAQDVDDQKKIWFRRIGSLILLLIFVSLLKVLGFAIMAPLFLFSLFRLYQRGDWKGDLIISFIGGICLWFLFVPILHMNLKGEDLDPVTPFLLNSLKAVGL